jgi:DNA-binding Lrp family transcriptional regulator
MMDIVDRIILERLKINCRTSLQEFSRLTGISANEVKKRVEGLVTTGIIKGFNVIPSPLMTNEDTVISILEFDSEPHEKKLLNDLRNSPSVAKVSRLLDGRYIVIGTYFMPQELTTLTLLLRNLEAIKQVEMYSRFRNYWGGEIVLTNSHKEILRCLVSNPRIPISDIAQETSLPSDTIKKIIDEMRESEAVLFTIDASNEVDEGSIEVLAKVQWNVGKTSHEHVLGWLQQNFANSYLGEYVSAVEPTLFFNFSVNHVQEVEIIVRKVRESGLISTIEPLILFPGANYPDPRQRRLNELLIETGFSS